jgi:hypothetical protein
MNKEQCTTPGCVNTIRVKRLSMCASCAQRLERTGTPMRVELPAGPVRDLLSAYDDSEETVCALARRIGVAPKTIRKYKKGNVEMLPLEVVDLVLTRLHVHPTQVWPNGEYTENIYEGAQ